MIKFTKTARRKSVFFAFFLFSILLSSNLLLAQKQNSAPTTKEIVNRMSKELGLNETQKSQVTEILNAEKASVEAIFNEERKKLESVQQQTRVSLQEILTPEQMQKLEKKMSQKNKKPGAQKAQ